MQFDLTGLAIAVLMMLRLLDIKHASSVGWPLDALKSALWRVESVPLQTKLTKLLRIQ